jgi:hypothetical protein
MCSYHCNVCLLTSSFTPQFKKKIRNQRNKSNQGVGHIKYDRARQLKENQIRISQKMTPLCPFHFLKVATRGEILLRLGNPWYFVIDVLLILCLFMLLFVVVVAGFWSDGVGQRAKNRNRYKAAKVGDGIIFTMWFWIGSILLFDEKSKWMNATYTRPVIERIWPWENYLSRV